MNLCQDQAAEWQCADLQDLEMFLQERIDEGTFKPVFPFQPQFLWVGGFWNAKAESLKPPCNIAWGKLKQTKAETQFWIQNRGLHFSDHEFWWTVQTISMQFAPLLWKIQSVWMSVVHCIGFSRWLQQKSIIGWPCEPHLQPEASFAEIGENDQNGENQWSGNAGQWSGNAANDREMPPPSGVRGFWTKFDENTRIGEIGQNGKNQWPGNAGQWPGNAGGLTGKCRPMTGKCHPLLEVEDFEQKLVKIQELGKTMMCSWWVSVPSWHCSLKPGAKLQPAEDSLDP